MHTGPTRANGIYHVNVGDTIVPLRFWSVNEFSDQFIPCFCAFSPIQIINDLLWRWSIGICCTCSLCCRSAYGLYDTIYGPLSIGIYIISIRCLPICYDVSVRSEIVALWNSILVSINPLPAIVIPGCSCGICSVPPSCLILLPSDRVVRKHRNNHDEW